MKNLDQKRTVTWIEISPSSWLGIIQLLLIHWKIAYGITIPWWMIFIPIYITLGSVILGGIGYFLYSGVRYTYRRIKGP